MVRSSSGHAVDLAVHDGQVAHQLLDDIGDQGLVVGFPQPGQMVGVLQQRHRSQRDHARRRFVTGLQQNRAVHGRGRAVELASGDVVGDQPAHQVVARFAFLQRHQLAHVVEHRAHRRGLLLVGRSASRGRSCCGAGRTRGPRRARRAAARSPARAPAARKSRTRSAGGPASIMSSRNPSTNSWICGRIVSARRKVKSRVIIRRSRLCSGSSIRAKITGMLSSDALSFSASGSVFALQPRIGQGRPDVLVAADHPRRLMAP